MRKHLLIICLFLLLVSCKPATRVHVSLDVDSFLPDDARAVTANVPMFTGISYFILPGIQVDDLGATPDENMKHGLLVSVPLLPAQSDLTVRFVIELRLTNPGSSPLSAWIVDLYYGSEDVTDLYSEGGSVRLAEGPSVPAGGTATVDMALEIDSGSPLFNTVEEGAVRLGINGEVEGGSQPADVLLEINNIAVDVSFRAFSLFRLLP